MCGILKRHFFLISSILLSFSPTNAFANELNPIDILQKSFSSKDLSFSGVKTQRVIRRDLRLEAKAKVDYVDAENYSITLNEPQGISGINLFTNYGKSTIYFPGEKLAFNNADKSGGQMITDSVLGRITNDLLLLQQNYLVSLLDEDEISGKPAYVVDLRPKNGDFRTPGRTFWLNKENYQILREDRYWGADIEPFFSSQYTQYKPLSYSTSPNVKVKLPTSVKKIELGKKDHGEETYLGTYKSVQEAEKALKSPVAVPEFLPPGFRLREIQVLNFYDTKIFIEKFDDGLNTAYVTYRTKPNFFLTLVAGNFSLNLIHKMSDLSYHAPYNYYSKETEQHLVIAFGDLYPEDLNEMCKSLKIK